MHCTTLLIALLYSELHCCTLDIKLLHNAMNISLLYSTHYIVVLYTLYCCTLQTILLHTIHCIVTHTKTTHPFTLSCWRLVTPAGPLCHRHCGHRHDNLQVTDWTLGCSQGSEKWIAQIATLLDKIPSVGQISFWKYGKILQNTYNLNNVKQCLVQVSDDWRKTRRGRPLW